MDQAGLDAIRLTAADGYAGNIGQADVAKGILCMDDEGLVCAVFDGLPGNTSVKDLLKIEAVE